MAIDFGAHDFREPWVLVRTVDVRGPGPASSLRLYRFEVLRKLDSSDEVHIVRSYIRDGQYQWQYFGLDVEERPLKGTADEALEDHLRRVVAFQKS